MQTIFSSSALRTHQREVKEAASQDVVHITENGNGAYVLCSEEVFASKMREAAERALWERDLSEAIAEGLADVRAGRVHDDVYTLLDAAEGRVAANG